jgi:hypothetical protein
MHGVHDLRMVIFFCANLLVNVGVSARLCLRLRYGNRGTHGNCKEANDLGYQNRSPVSIHWAGCNSERELTITAVGKKGNEDLWRPGIRELQCPWAAGRSTGIQPALKFRFEETQVQLFREVQRRLSDSRT